MPAYLPSSGALTTKLVSLFPRNIDRPTHQAVIVVFDPTNGSPVALMDGEAITAARTAAGSALATDLLARADASRLVVIGTGVQARAHLRAGSGVRRFGSISVVGRDLAKAKALAREFGAGNFREVGAYVDIGQAVREADVVCACTHAAEPVIRREWLRPGTHVNSVGYNTAGGGEVDADTLRDAYVVVEWRDAALAPPPAGAVELRDGARVDADIGELVRGVAEGRTSREQLT